MNARRTLAVVSKEWREIVRDRLFLVLAFVVPSMLMLLFGFGLSLDVENIPLAIVDYDNTSLSREYANTYTSSRYFDFKGYSRDEDELGRQLSSNELRAYIVIPEHFERNLLNGQSAAVQTMKERGSIYNIYASTVSRGEFLLGKITPYVLISLTNAVILWLMATFVFDAPFKGNFLFFLFSTTIYVICTTGIGLVISVLVETQVAAMVVTAIATIIPAALYSGVLVPVPSLSGQAQVIAHLLPAMYYTNIVTGIFLKGASIATLWRDIVVLVAYAIGLFTLGYALFHKRPKS